MGRYDASFTFNDLIGYVSNVALDDPCSRTVSSGAETVSCSDPIEVLSVGGVLVSWQIGSKPTGGPDVPQPNTTVDRRSAHLAISRPGDCARLGGQETITVEIARPRGDHDEMVACIRGPGLTGNEMLVRHMLASTRVIA